MTPEQVAVEVLGVKPAHLTASRIKGGLTNESWCVAGDGIAVVVRISTVDEQALQLNRHSEAVVLSLVHRVDIGAEVLLCAPERRLLVTRKLPAETLSLQDLSDPIIVQRLAQLLRSLHSLSIPTNVQRIDLLAVLHGYWHSLEAQGRTINSADRKRALAIANESAQSTLRCLCHNDVHHLNLMSNGQRLWLLDWEYAGIGDPFFDLASVCSYHGYDESQCNQLLVAYRGELIAHEAERLQRMCWLFDYIKELWLAVRHLEDDEAFDSDGDSDGNNEGNNDANNDGYLDSALDLLGR